MENKLRNERIKIICETAKKESYISISDLADVFAIEEKSSEIMNDLWIKFDLIEVITLYINGINKKKSASKLTKKQKNIAYIKYLKSFKMRKELWEILIKEFTLLNLSSKSYRRYKDSERVFFLINVYKKSNGTYIRIDNNNHFVLYLKEIFSDLKKEKKERISNESWNKKLFRKELESSQSPIRRKINDVNMNRNKNKTNDNESKTGYIFTSSSGIGTDENFEKFEDMNNAEAFLRIEDIYDWIVILKKSYSVKISFPKLLLGNKIEIYPPENEVHNKKEDSNYSFIERGEYWTIVYDKVKFRLRDEKGFKELKYLISNPHKSFSYSELLDATEGVENLNYEDTAKVYYDELRMSEINDNIHDRKYLEDVKNKLYKLKEQRKDAEENGNLIILKECDNEIVEIQKNLKTKFGKNSYSASFNGPLRRIMYKTKQRIKRTIDKIKNKNESCGLHLQKFIDCDESGAMYRPDRTIDWKVSEM